MQKEVCFDGQGQSEPIKNYKVIKNSENTQVPKASKKSSNNIPSHKQTRCTSVDESLQESL